MNLDVTCEPRPGYLAFTASGTFDVETVQQLTATVRDGCERHNCSRALVDMRPLAGNPGDFDRFVMGQHVAEVLGWRIKVAVVSRPDVINKVGENTAVNRGARVLVCSDEQAALDWLLKG